MPRWEWNDRMGDRGVPQMRGGAPRSGFSLRLDNPFTAGPGVGHQRLRIHFLIAPRL
jgi:hypothetical protein